MRLTVQLPTSSPNGVKHQEKLHHKLKKESKGENEVMHSRVVALDRKL